MGLSLYQYLTARSIRFAAFVVDDDYLSEGMSFEGRPVESFEEVQKRLGEFDVMIGHADARRAPEIGKLPGVREVFYSSGLSYGQTAAFPEAFVREHADEYEMLYERLEDEKSRECLVSFLSARICDDASYVWPYAPGHEETYFDNDVYTPSEDEIYLDIGAYTGDTIEDFAVATGGRYREILGIEAEDHNFEQLRSTADRLRLHDCRLFRTGTWKEETVLFLSEDAQQSSVLRREDARGATTREEIRGHEIPVMPVDLLLRREGTKGPITTYKINFYAGVLETLMGSAETLQKDRPKIILTVGFDRMALLKLPGYLQSILPDYVYYLRYMQAMPGRLTLFALPR